MALLKYDTLMELPIIHCVHITVLENKDLAKSIYM